MTAIVYRDGVMAADTMSWVRGVAICAPAKIIRVDGGLLGAAGPTGVCHWLRRYLANPDTAGPKPPVERDDLQALLVERSGQIWRWDWQLVSFQHLGSFVAIGAASEFLYGALYAGASAEDAVRLAIRHTDCAAGDVQIERLHP